MTAGTTRRRPSWRAVGVIGSVMFVCVALVAVLLAEDPGETGGTGGTGGTGDAARTGEAKPLRIGYVPYWDQRRALDVVWQHPVLFDQVSPVWYSLTPAGRIVLADDHHTHVDPAAVRAMQARGIKVLPTVTNLRNGDWDLDLVPAMLHDPKARRTHIRALVELVREKDYDGIDIDYESLNAADRKAYTAFLTELGRRLHADGKLLATAVHPKTSNAGDDPRNLAQNYRAIGAAVDQVRVMTYDYSWDTSPPGPVAPARWVDRVIAWTVTQIPPQKVVLGVDLLGYDWSGGRGVTVSDQRARSLADAHGARIRRSEDGSPWFSYRDSSGNRHEVWWEDARSARAKLALVDQYGLGGVFFWRLGGEDSALWPEVRATW